MIHNNDQTEYQISARITHFDFDDDDLTIHTEPGYVDDATVLDPSVRQPDGPLGFLIVKEPARWRGAVYTVHSHDTIGSQGTHIVLPDPHIARRHARIRLESIAPVSFVLDRLQPSDGLLVNSQPVQTSARLVENDEIRIGRFTFVFKVLP